MVTGKYNNDLSRKLAWAKFLPQLISNGMLNC